MKKLLLTAAVLALGAWAVPPALAEQQQGAQQTQQTMESAAPQQAQSGDAVNKEGSANQPPMQEAGVPEAVQGGVAGDCPAGEVRNPNGDCMPGQPDATGTLTGDAGATDMPASPHQQQLLTTTPPEPDPNGGAGQSGGTQQ